MTLDYIPAARVRSSAPRRLLMLSGLLVTCVGAAAYVWAPYSSPTAGSAAEVVAPQPLAAASAPPPAAATTAYDGIVDAAVSDALKVPEDSDWKIVTVRRGQTLSTIFEHYGLPADDWIDIVGLGGDAARLKRLRVGDKLRLELGQDHLQALDYAYDETHTLEIRRQGDRFQATTLTAELQHRPATASGVIENSLFVDGQRAGLSDSLILQLAQIFDYDIDFAQDLQQGDRFSVIYDQIYKNGKKLRDGDILAAEFVNQGHTYRAVRFVEADGRVAYFTPSGQSLRRAFIRTPVDFTRISSGFSHARMNPVLHIIRPHFGTDYAAPIGTPVRVTGDGRVEFIGRKGGYGNVIMVRHGARYETVYAHLSRFRKGLHVGSKVHQGQVIAYVGMTGLATGPHLHYEFRVNGIPRNPLTVKLPRGNPVPARLLAKFKREEAPLLAQLRSVDSNRYADNSALGSP